jgi:hypothetical protein
MNSIDEHIRMALCALAAPSEHAERPPIDDPALQVPPRSHGRRIAVWGVAAASVMVVATAAIAWPGDNGVGVTGTPTTSTIASTAPISAEPPTSATTVVTEPLQPVAPSVEDALRAEGAWRVMPEAPALDTAGAWGTFGAGQYVVQVGLDTSSTQVVQVLDTATETWRLADIPSIATPQEAVWTGSVLAFEEGLFDPETLAWQELPDPPTSGALTHGVAAGSWVVWPTYGVRLNVESKSWNAVAPPPVALGAVGRGARVWSGIGSTILVGSAFGEQWLTYDADTDVWGTPGAGPTGNSLQGAWTGSEVVMTAYTLVSWTWTQAEGWTELPTVPIDGCEGVTSNQVAGGTAVVQSFCGSAIAMWDRGAWRLLETFGMPSLLSGTSSGLYDASVNQLWRPLARGPE